MTNVQAQRTNLFIKLNRDGRYAGEGFGAHYRTHAAEKQWSEKFAND
jgi:hypothetical protein